MALSPRSAGTGTAYLVEIEAYDPTEDEVVTLRFSSGGYNTSPEDDPANAHFSPRLVVPGDYSRALFGTGGTSGAIDVGAGVTELINADGGLDHLIDHAFDGYPITIMALDRGAQWDDRVTVFAGTMETVDFTWRRLKISIRDRLAALDKPLQTVLFAGTTVAGGMNEAEGGPDDLKGKPKPLCYGAPRQVEAVSSNVYDEIFSLGQNGLDSVTEVRDGGVALTYSGNNYTTVAALRGASISSGQYSTARNLGLVRTGAAPAKILTAAPVKGANAAARTAGQLARLILLQMGLVEDTDFLASDVAALDVANDAEIGYWIGAEEQTALAALTAILGSIGATCVPDREGVFRLYRFEAPSGTAVATFTDAEITEKQATGIERLATGDKGSGVPAWRVSLRYGYNGAVMKRDALDVSVSDAFKAFASEEWRTAVAEDSAVKDIHLLSPELTFDTYLIAEADAQAEAARLLALHGVRRDRFLVPVKSYLAEGVDLNSVVTLKTSRFGLSEGRDFRVIGLAENLESGITTLDIWG